MTDTTRQQELIRLAQAGDKKARDTLILENQGLVGFTLGKFHKKYGRVSGMIDHEDLYQEGMFGLIKAIEQYDESVGSAFSTYAVIKIEAAIGRAKENGEGPVRVPVWKKWKGELSDRKTSGVHLASDDDLLTETGGYLLTVPDKFVHDIEVSDELEDILHPLSPLVREVLLDGWLETGEGSVLNRREIAERHGMTLSKMRRIVSKELKKIR